MQTQHIHGMMCPLAGAQLTLGQWARRWNRLACRFQYRLSTAAVINGVAGGIAALAAVSVAAAAIAALLQGGGGPEAAEVAASASRSQVTVVAVTVSASSMVGWSTRW